jgi:hypothetical protein
MVFVQLRGVDAVGIGGESVRDHPHIKLLDIPGKFLVRLLAKEEYIGFGSE